MRLGDSKIGNGTVCFGLSAIWSRDAMGCALDE